MNHDDIQPPSPLPGWSFNLHKALKVERKSNRALHQENLELRDRIQTLGTCAGGHLPSARC